MQSPDAAPRRRSVVVFDVGGVLLQLGSAASLPQALRRRRRSDGGISSATSAPRNGTSGRTRAARSPTRRAELLPAHADKAHLIHAFGRRFDEMIPGAIEGTVDILRELKRAGVPLYALTNWSAETFPSAQNRFDFLAEFDGIVVSGEEGVIKPDPRIFRILLDRYDIRAARRGLHRRQSGQCGSRDQPRHPRHSFPLAAAPATRARRRWAFSRNLAWPFCSASTRSPGPTTTCRNWAATFRSTSACRKREWPATPASSSAANFRAP